MKMNNEIIPSIHVLNVFTLIWVLLPLGFLKFCHLDKKNLDSDCDLTCEIYRDINKDIKINCFNKIVLEYIYCFLKYFLFKNILK